MTWKPRSSSPVFLLLLLTIGLAMPGCETAEDPLSADPSGRESWLAIGAGADGASAWLLMMPDGTEVAGSGDSLLADPPEGEYWVLWEPVEEWNSPAVNPEQITFTEGSTETVEPAYARIQGDMGDITIDVGPEKLRPRWNLHGPDGFFAAGKGPRTLKRRAVGEYRILWDDEPGFRTPPDASGRLSSSAPLVFAVVYEEAAPSTGDIQIDVQPESVAASWELRSAGGQTWSGAGDELITALETGEYTITWGAVEGYETPAPASAVLDPDEVLVLLGNYTQAQVETGSIAVDPNPDALSAPWQLVSSSGGNWSGNGDQLLEGLAPDSYTITWGAVGGHVTPAPVSAQLEAGTTLQLQANYVEEFAPVGTIVINPDPDALDAPWTLGSDVGITASGSGDSTLADLPVANYVVVWGAVDGYLTPDSEVGALVEGGRLEFSAVYDAEAEPLGTVRIDPNPDELNAPWSIVSDGGLSFTGNGDSTLNDLPPGEYTLTWGQVDGWETPSPNPVTQTLGAGATAVFALE